jgi:hypothetical protein
LSDFITWDGGEQSPVPPFSHILVKFRDSENDSDEVYYSQSLDWSHGEDGPEFDVVAYKLADEQPVFEIWTGGTNPAGESIVEYVLRADPDDVNCLNANFLDWVHEIDDPDYDIILYRIIA